MGSGSFSSAVPKVTIQRAPKKSSLSTLLVKPLEEVRPALPVGIPPFREGKHRVRLYAGHRSGALPRTPSSTQAPYRLLRRQRQGAFIPLRLLSKRNPLRWAFVWVETNRERSVNAEREKNGDHHPPSNTADQRPHPGQGTGAWPDRH